MPTEPTVEGGAYLNTIAGALRKERGLSFLGTAMHVELRDTIESTAAKLGITYFALLHDLAMRERRHVEDGVLERFRANLTTLENDNGE